MVCHFRNYVIKDTRASEKENQLPCHELPYGSGKELTRSIRVGLEMDSPAVMSLDSNLWETLHENHTAEPFPIPDLQKLYEKINIC